MTNPPLWKASISLAKAEAADVSAALELDGSAQAVLIVEEPFADGAGVAGEGVHKRLAGRGGVHENCARVARSFANLSLPEYHAIC